VVAWLLGTAIVIFAGGAFLWRLASPKWGESVNLKSWIRKVPLSSMAACRCEADEAVEISRADGLRLAGSIDLPSTSGTHPTVVLLHGNTPFGRKLGVYRILARRLTDRGYRVLSFDFAGRGESEDPFRFGTREALDSALDTRAALRFLETLEGIDRERVYIVCHSAGCRSGLSVGLDEPVVKAIVAIGPPRRDRERLLDEDNNEHLWIWACRVREELWGTGFPEWYTRDVWMEERRGRNLERHLEILSRESHKPVLLMDGELEREADRAYLRGYFDRMAEPKGYVTVPRSNHYANTISKTGVVLYDREVVNRTVDAIESFLASDHPRGKP
jgi:pimeloyl-ACP methyl ester carboxylesterase